MPTKSVICRERDLRKSIRACIAHWTFLQIYQQKIWKITFQFIAAIFNWSGMPRESFDNPGTSDYVP